MEKILYLTVPHTGTTSFAELFKSDRKVHFVEMDDIWVTKENDRNIDTLFIKDRLNIIHSHLEPRLLSLIHDYQDTGLLTVATLRDPLLSIITERHLKGQYTWRGDASHLVKQFLCLKDAVMRSNKITPMLPVDLLSPLAVPTRYAYLSNTLPFINEDKIDKYANDWTLYKPSGDNPLKTLYRLRLADELKQFLPREWQALEAAEPELRPFMETYGYKNLLWWKG